MRLKVREPFLLSGVMLLLIIITATIFVEPTFSQSFSIETTRRFPIAQEVEPRVRAPELKGGRGWLNTDKPLSLAALKGKIVLLDFWTYGCVNCLHLIPHLKKLEQKYVNQLL
jgi:thiol-disulfide isomerase/thioredoxin